MRPPGLPRRTVKYRWRGFIFSQMSSGQTARRGWRREKLLRSVSSQISRLRVNKDASAVRVKSSLQCPFDSSVVSLLTVHSVSEASSSTLLKRQSCGFPPPVSTGWASKVGNVIHNSHLGAGGNRTHPVPILLHTQRT